MDEVVDGQVVGSGLKKSAHVGFYQNSSDSNDPLFVDVRV